MPFNCMHSINTSRFDLQPCFSCWSTIALSPTTRYEISPLVRRAPGTPAWGQGSFLCWPRSTSSSVSQEGGMGSPGFRWGGSSLCRHMREPFFSLAESHCGTWAKEVLISFLKKYFSKIVCFIDHNQCCQSYRWPTSAFPKAASKDSSACVPKAEDPAMEKGTGRVSKLKVKSHYPHVGQRQERSTTKQNH